MTTPLRALRSGSAFVLAIAMTLAAAPKSYGQPIDGAKLAESILAVEADIRERLIALPASDRAEIRAADALTRESLQALAFAAEAAAKGQIELAMDAMALAQGTVQAAADSLATPATATAGSGNLAVAANAPALPVGLSGDELAAVATFASRIAAAEQIVVPDPAGLASRLQAGGFALAAVESALDAIGSSTDAVASRLALSLASIQDLGDLQRVMANLDGETLSAAFGSTLSQIGLSIGDMAAAVAQAVTAGANVNLDAVAQGAGFDSFAAAVDAYNAAYGTNYSVDQAREALGQ